MKIAIKCKHCGELVEVKVIDEDDPFYTCPNCYHDAKI